MRVDTVGAKAAQRFLSTEIEQRFQNFAFKALHQFQRHIEEVACAAGRIEHPRLAKRVVEDFYLSRSALEIAQRA